MERAKTARHSRVRCLIIRGVWAPAATKPGLSATCYPTGVSAVPVEVLEASIPIEFTQKELILGSGGRGAHCGGDGQSIGFRMRTGKPWALNAIPSRLKLAPEG